MTVLTVFTITTVSLYLTVYGGEVRSLTYTAPVGATPSLAVAPCALKCLASSNCGGFEMLQSGEC